MPEVVRSGLAISTNSSPMMDEDESESMTLSDEEQSCPRNHIHRQDKEEIYVLSDEEEMDGNNVANFLRISDLLNT